MGLTGTLKRISTQKCPHCKKEYGKHSKKSFMRCLYTANVNLYNITQQLEIISPNRYDVVEKTEKPKAEKLTIDNEGNLKVEEIES